MSKTAQQIAQKLKEMNHRENDTMIGTVNSVDSDNAVCEVDVDGLTYSEVQLKSIMKSGTKGVKLLPKKDSVVIVERIGKSNELFITMYSEIDSISWEIEDMKLFVDKNGFVFNDGNNKGMVILQKIVERYNKIEQDINNLKTALTGWTPVSQHGGAALKAAAASWAGQQLVKTVDNDIENTKVKH